MTVRQGFIYLAVILPLLVIVIGFWWPAVYWVFLLLVPVISLGIWNLLQKRKTILRNYPVIGHFRYMFESVRPEIQQYFVESDLNGTPVSREFRALVYQRAKGQRDTRPFGTQFDVYRVGYEWLDHSIAPTNIHHEDPRVLIGGKQCSQPYAASPLNISAMSFGSLSKNAILALNKGAALGNFAHNTGEGGVTPYHLEHGGDIIWQIGTGYFGCRTPEGLFSAEMFAEKARHSAVKMIEIKISQGAKPGHGGILPAAKVTSEIAEIRGVIVGQDVISPPMHSAFYSPVELLEFIAQLRELSKGKPVGFKLCIGRRYEFMAICKAMQQTGMSPDFIAIDGGEGGTGAAPAEFSNSLGAPLRDGLNFAHNALRACAVRDNVKLIASGKVYSAFHMLRLMALGADSIAVARAMMFALGCIQSRQCNSDTCPTGIATQNPQRYLGLDVEDKGERVFRYHQDTIETMNELAAAAGMRSFNDVRPEHVNRRVAMNQVQTYAELYPRAEIGCLLPGSSANVPDDLKAAWEMADIHHWLAS